MPLSVAYRTLKKEEEELLYFGTCVCALSAKVLEGYSNVCNLLTNGPEQINSGVQLSSSVWHVSPSQAANFPSVYNGRNFSA